MDDLFMSHMSVNHDRSGWAARAVPGARWIPTTQLSLIQEHTEKIRPPRALWVPFPFGRPVGMPGDAAFQAGVVVAALRPLERSDTPVLHDYPVEADQGEEVSLAGLSCPVRNGNAASGQTEEERIAAAVAQEIQQNPEGIGRNFTALLEHRDH
jgi:hypothetical protein